MDEHYFTLDEIRAIPEEHYPILLYCDGGSLFSWLIRLVDKSAQSHLQWLAGPDCIATQWLWFKTYPVEHMRGYTTKMIWNPEWTPQQRATLQKAIADRLALPWYRKIYDIPGVIGEALNLPWLQLPRADFCSEAVARMLRLVDPAFEEWLKTHPSPTPREINLYTKAHNPPYKVYGRYAPDDDI